jgi:hypothetical protein
MFFSFTLGFGWVCSYGVDVVWVWRRCSCFLLPLPFTLTLCCRSGAGSVLGVSETSDYLVQLRHVDGPRPGKQMC